MPAPIKNYKKGAAWFVASLFISCLNDTVAKHLIRNANYPPLQITFCRLLIGTIFTGGYLYYKSKIKPSAYYYRYLLLGGLLAASSILWTWGLVYTSTVTATVIDFSTPLFVLMLAPRFLTEYPSSTLWRSVVGGLVGTCIMVGREGLTWHNTVLLLVMASFFFALLDLLNKKWLPEEGWGALMLFPNLIATIITAPSCYYWVPPP